MNEGGLDLQEEEAEEPETKVRVKRAAVAVMLIGLAAMAYYANRPAAAAWDCFGFRTAISTPARRTTLRPPGLRRRGHTLSTTAAGRPWGK